MVRSALTDKRELQGKRDSKRVKVKREKQVIAETKDSAVLKVPWVGLESQDPSGPQESQAQEENGASSETWVPTENQDPREL